MGHTTDVLRPLNRQISDDSYSSMHQCVTCVFHYGMNSLVNTGMLSHSSANTSSCGPNAKAVNILILIAKISSSTYFVLSPRSLILLQCTWGKWKKHIPHEHWEKTLKTLMHASSKSILTGLQKQIYPTLWHDHRLIETFYDT